MTEIKLYKSQLKALGLIAMTIPLVAGGIWIIKKEPSGTFDYRMGWACITFFSLALAVGLFHLLDRRP
jgi:hypothetical protein